MWASTGCQSKVGCETATCLRNNGYPDGFCPPSTGPTGPVTKAEFTLVSVCVPFTSTPPRLMERGRGSPCHRVCALFLLQQRHVLSFSFWDITLPRLHVWGGEFHPASAWLV